MTTTTAEVWERRYLLTEIKYARLLLATAERELELFDARAARAATGNGEEHHTAAIQRALEEARREEGHKP